MVWLHYLRNLALKCHIDVVETDSDVFCGPPAPGLSHGLVKSLWKHLWLFCMFLKERDHATPLHFIIQFLHVCYHSSAKIAALPSRLSFLTVSELTLSLEPNHRWYSCAHSHCKRHIGLKKKERNFVCVVVEVMFFIHKPPFVLLSVCQMFYAFVFCLFMYILCLLSSHRGGGLIVNDLQYWSYYVKTCSG